MTTGYTRKTKIPVSPELKEKLNERIKKSIGKSPAVSLNPAGIGGTDKPEHKHKEGPPAPDIKDLIGDAEEVVTLTALIRLAAHESEQAALHTRIADKARDRIKAMVSVYGIERMKVGVYTASYFSTERSSLSREKLLAAGVRPAVLEECTTTNTSYSLRIIKDSNDDQP